MDIWKYYAITHRDHLVCNSTNEAKLNELVELLSLPSGARALDIACGKAELLCRIAARYAAAGTGVDISPYGICAARKKAGERGLAGSVEIVEGNGAKYEAPHQSFDAALCIGASWIWQGHRGTLRALSHWTKPGGLVVVGEPYRLQPPDPEYRAAEPEFVDSLVSHYDNVAIGEEEGLTLLYALVSNQDDWDRYEALQWHAAETYAEENPRDPDVPELLERMRKGRDIYLKWGRTTLNWAIYLFRKPG